MAVVSITCTFVAFCPLCEYVSLNLRGPDTREVHQHLYDQHSAAVREVLVGKHHIAVYMTDSSELVL